MTPLLRAAVVLIGLGLFWGCGPAEESETATSAETQGAYFKTGKGVYVSDETAAIIGLETAEVSEKFLPKSVHFGVQIFTENHRLADLSSGHAKCHFHGAGFLPAAKVEGIKPGQALKVRTADDEMLDGFIAAIQPTLVQGELEVVIGITGEDKKLRDGDFADAVVAIARETPVLTVPEEAVLRTVHGTFVYTVNGEAFYRTEVSAGSVYQKQVEIHDGLYGGDVVVVRPVQTLWLVELRATKGGGHCH